MPELPEVENIRRQLREEVAGRRILSCRVLLSRLVVHPSPRTYEKAAAGCRVVDVGRRGKYLLFSLDNNLQLVIHLGMSGSLILAAPGDPHPPHTHIRYLLDDGRNLLYVDPRTFGETALVPAGDWRALPGLQRMGPEPLDSSFTVETLSSVLRGKGKIKAVLLDQSRLAGIGNIYADEILHRAGIHPCRPACSLDEEERTVLHRRIREVLEEALEKMGSSTSNYVDTRGERGSFQQCHRVYRRLGLPCPRCGTPVERRRVAGRSSYYCPACQPEEGRKRPGTPPIPSPPGPS